MDGVSAIKTASQMQMDYMKLLVVQLQNQNPLEPLDNNEMTLQLAQLSQLGQLESMNSSFAKVLETVARDYAGSLIGKEVSFFTETEQGDVEMTNGVVEQVYNDVDGQILLGAGNYVFALEDVMSVRN